MWHAVAPVIAAMLTPMLLIADTPFVRDNAVPKNTDLKATELIFSDIALFWKAYDSAKPENRVEILREEYLKKGSAGLKEFTRKRIGSAENLAAEIAKRPKYYASLREPSGRIGRYEDAIRASFRKLKELYEPAVFPKVYFLIGAMNSGGTVTNTGLLIGVDMYGITKTTPMEELGPWHRTVLKPIDQIPHIVAHELIHYQQKYPKGNATLLQMAIMEGSADFLAELISGSHINGHLHEYGNPRERELWAEFSQEMDGKDTSKWLFQGDRAKNRPADLGYYIGYKICESYHKQAANKKEAIRDILEIKDFKAFLKASRYESRFQAPSDRPEPARPTFDSSKAGDEKAIAGVKICWCPPGKFTMRSPVSEQKSKIRWAVAGAQHETCQLSPCLGRLKGCAVRQQVCLRRLTMKPVATSLLVFLLTCSYSRAADEAAKRQLTVTDEQSGISVGVMGDDRTLVAKNKQGKVVWEVDVIKVAGTPGVGKPVIRHLSMKDGKVVAVYGKHSFADFDLKSGKLLSSGSD